MEKTIISKKVNNKHGIPKKNRIATARPFLKWAGGKTKLLPKLKSLSPRKFNRYFEPFLGGGALFFNLKPKSAILSDINEELINAFIVVRDSPLELLNELKEIPVNSSTFYNIRKKNPHELDKIQRAARLIYLNKTCYNGLYRVNKKGQFNTPYGKNDKAVVYRPKSIMAASYALKDTEILCCDFQDVLLKRAQEGDFIYLDPPYPPAGEFSDFTRYTTRNFYKRDHLELVKVVEEIDRRNSRFILSYPNHPVILDLYPDFKIIKVQAARSVNCKGDRRGNVPEILITNLKI